VDAVYLSKELQVALRVDELCDVYNKEILLTNELYLMLSDKAKMITRKIESIVMKEQPKQPLVSPFLLFKHSFRMYFVVILYKVSLYQSTSM
jgi:hypothetical protein